LLFSRLMRCRCALIMCDYISFPLIYLLISAPPAVWQVSEEVYQRFVNKEHMDMDEFAVGLD